MWTIELGRDKTEGMLNFLRLWWARQKFLSVLEKQATFKIYADQFPKEAQEGIAAYWDRKVNRTMKHYLSLLAEQEDKNAQVKDSYFGTGPN